MSIKTLAGWVAGLIAVIVLGFYFFHQSKAIPSHKPIIVISQIIDHNTLNTVHKGLIDGLKEQGYIDGQTVEIFYENAHGNYTLSKQIADKFISLKPSVMVGLSTQSAQSFLNASLSKNIPLVFSAVTDPVAAKLSGPTVTGISDFMPAEPQLNLFLKLLPNLKKLGVIYNPSEINSVSFIEKFEQVALKKGIILVRAALNSTAEATAVTASLVGKVDAIYFPNDNTAMAAVKAIVTVGLKHHLPVFANDTASVEQGAVAAVAYDRYEMGKMTALMVVKILKGESPSEIPVIYDAATQIVTNKESLKNLSLPGS
ncbi:ABC transporter substrate-binding protein [Candidatus Finniella inopinata]|uniref:ABC transporter substrate-binding protein n=1 Tax=Candidatus Finniella inopinata TaxID=1696036 RepID=A0A4Q7DFG5_9PROT|nr:ABC transporter substrate-binding protein [Candidatus Finniella inopinata]RZI45521.1 ABC transporter substrate-binding protein [Candidatus Finniella inopinata]